MAADREARRQACVAKATAEITSLAERGVAISGQAFSSILLLKGGPAAVDLEDGVLAGDDGDALRAALTALGYAPEDWAALLTCSREGVPLDPELLREAIAALDPATFVACDEAAADALKSAYPAELAAIEALEEAMLVPGCVAHVLGMRVLALGGFAASLASASKKQEMWRYLKQIPPLGEPY